MSNMKRHLEAIAELGKAAWEAEESFAALREGWGETEEEDGS